MLSNLSNRIRKNQFHRPKSSVPIDTSTEKKGQGNSPEKKILEEEDDFPSDMGPDLFNSTPSIQIDSLRKEIEKSKPEKKEDSDKKTIKKLLKTNEDERIIEIISDLTYDFSSIKDKKKAMEIIKLLKQASKQVHSLSFQEHLSTTLSHFLTYNASSKYAFSILDAVHTLHKMQDSLLRLQLLKSEYPSEYHDIQKNQHILYEGIRSFFGKINTISGANIPVIKASLSILKKHEQNKKEEILTETLVTSVTIYKLCYQIKNRPFFDFLSLHSQDMKKAGYSKLYNKKSLIKKLLIKFSPSHPLNQLEEAITKLSEHPH
mgnify:FL=1